MVWDAGDEGEKRAYLDMWAGLEQGWGPWRKDWISVCSAHHGTEVGCLACMTGNYHNRWASKAERFLASHAYWLWHWWVNRPNSRTRKQLEEAFLNLKG